MQNILKSSIFNDFINFKFFMFKIKISFKILKINKIWKIRKINFCSRWDLNPQPLDFRDQRLKDLVIENESHWAIMY